MTYNIDMVENAWLGGSTDFDIFIEKFEADFMAPVEERMQRVLWASLTPMQKEMFRIANPEAYAAIEAQMGKEV